MDQRVRIGWDGKTRGVAGTRPWGTTTRTTNTVPTTTRTTNPMPEARPGVGTTPERLSHLTPRRADDHPRVLR
jgi:hypothetical protein